jgi:hypothetical protein
MSYYGAASFIKNAARYYFLPQNYMKILRFPSAHEMKKRFFTEEGINNLGVLYGFRANARKHIFNHQMQQNY